VCVCVCVCVRACVRACNNRDVHDTFQPETEAQDQDVQLRDDSESDTALSRDETRRDETRRGRDVYSSRDSLNIETSRTRRSYTVTRSRTLVRGLLDYYLGCRVCIYVFMRL